MMQWLRGSTGTNSPKVAPPGGPPEERAVCLEEIRDVLEVYLSGLMKEPPGVSRNRVWQEGQRYVFGLIRRANQQVCGEPGDSYTDLKRIYLPEQIGVGADRLENFSLYKAIVAHKYGQMRFGSLEVLGLFDRVDATRLAMDLYGLIEDARMERHLGEEMPGLGRLLARQRCRALLARPDPDALTAGESRVEALLRISLDADADLWAFPKDVVAWVRALHPKIAHLVANGSTPPDSARLALQIMQDLTRQDPDYQGVPPIPYRGKINLDGVLRTLRGAIQVQSVGHGAEGDGETGAAQKQDLKTDRPVRPEMAAFDEEEANRGILLNRFEKLSMIAKYFRISRPLDTDDDVEDLSKSLDELESTGMIRTARKAGSILRVEEGFDVETEPVEPEGAADETPGILLDEWDCRIGAFREAWCTLRERPYEHLDLEWAEQLMDREKHLFTRIRREFSALRPDYHRLKRRIDGEEVDHDSFIEALTDMRVGVTPSEKLYMQRIRRRKEIATAFLADLSASTDAYVRNLRVMDQQREALLLLGEAMEAIRDRYAIYGFSSKTRRQCDFYRLKGFEENYGPEIQARLGGMKPLDYTRMGPAIRHLTSILKNTRARLKLMIILSDGKPNDFDLYEGKYGIEDIRKALLEARAFGIKAFCITVDTEAREYLPHIFERGNFLILQEIESLPQKLVGMYRRLTGLGGSGGIV